MRRKVVSGWGRHHFPDTNPAQVQDSIDRAISVFGRERSDATKNNAQDATDASQNSESPAAQPKP